MRKLLTIGAIFLAVACGDSVSPSVSMAGTWTLETINGYPVPFKSPQPKQGDTVELTSDVLIVGASGAFTQMTVMRKTTAGLVTIDSIPDSGFYVTSGNHVTFDFDSTSPNGTGTVDGNTLTVQTDIRLVYKRQQ